MKEEDVVKMSRAKTQQKEQLESELARAQLRLENQKSLFTDLLKLNDTDMVNREVQNLDKVYDDMMATATQLRDLLAPEEAKEVSSAIATEDAMVFQVKKLVSKWMATQAEVDSGSRHSYSSKLSHRSRASLHSAASQKTKVALLKAEIEVLKKNRDTEVELLKTTQDAEISKMEALIEKEEKVGKVLGEEEKRTRLERIAVRGKYEVCEGKTRGEKEKKARLEETTAEKKKEYEEDEDEYAEDDSSEEEDYNIPPSPLRQY